MAFTSFRFSSFFFLLELDSVSESFTLVSRLLMEAIEARFNCLLTHVLGPILGWLRNFSFFKSRHNHAIISGDAGFKGVYKQ